MPQTENHVLINGSRLIIESLARAGADVFIGYPITPSNYLYFYSAERMPETFHAPDEITVLQWMAGFSAAGKIPVTATSFPGLALMIESINMAFMMELPMVIVLAQRLGPSTGTATCGAQGDILLLRGMISGGYQVPVLCISDFNDCWTLSDEALKLSVRLRTPVVLLTSKEIAMTNRSFNVSSLPKIEKITREFYSSSEKYVPYRPEKNSVPSFLPVGSREHQVRITSSTHDAEGLLQHSTKEALENTKRLSDKIILNIKDFSFYAADLEEDAETIIFTYGISSVIAREAVKILRKNNEKVSLLIAKTLFPVSNEYFEILSDYKKIVFVEENLNGDYAQVLFGAQIPKNIVKINSIGKMVSVDQIINGVMQNGE